MSTLYLNHNILINQVNYQKVLEKLIEIAKINKIITDMGYKQHIYSDIWSIQILNTTLSQLIYKLDDRDEVTIAILALINCGPYYFRDDEVKIVNIIPPVENESFSEELLNICFKDKQELIHSISDENQLTDIKYLIRDESEEHEVNNLIGLDGINTFFKDKFVPNKIEDVITQINKEQQNIVFLDSARKSAEMHDFMGRFIDVYKAINALNGELELIKKGINTFERQQSFTQITGFEISAESDRTMRNRKYKREREFLIQNRGVEIFEWHIKIGNKTRIHYFIDVINDIIYVGHCGKHLGTATYNS